MRKRSKKALRLQSHNGAEDIGQVTGLLEYTGMCRQEYRKTHIM